MTTTLTTERCGACHGDFATLNEVFSHDCPALAGRVYLRPNVTIDPSVDVDHRDRFGRRVNSTATGTRYRQAPPAAKPATDKQKAFVRTLLAERQGDAVDVVRARLNEAREAGALTTKVVSEAIEALLALPKVMTSDRPVERPAAGYTPATNDVHVVDGEYYRVHESQHGGWHYVAVWNGEKFVGPRFDDRAKGMLRRLSQATLATAEQAAAFGHVNERCCFCSTKIDTPESKAVGYGPKCAGDRGLPWGEA